MRYRTHHRDWGTLGAYGLGAKLRLSAQFEVIRRGSPRRSGRQRDSNSGSMTSGLECCPRKSGERATPTIGRLPGSRPETRADARWDCRWVSSRLSLRPSREQHVLCGRETGWCSAEALKPPPSRARTATGSRRHHSSRRRRCHHPPSRTMAFRFASFPIRNQVFYQSPLSLGLVNLKPLVPGRASSPPLAVHSSLTKERESQTCS